MSPATQLDRVVVVVSPRLMLMLVGVLAWGGGRAFLGGIKGACPAPLISPNQHMLIGKEREKEGGGGGGGGGEGGLELPTVTHAMFHTDYGSPEIFSPHFTPTLCIYIYCIYIYIHVYIYIFIYI